MLSLRGPWFNSHPYLIDLILSRSDEIVRGRRSSYLAAAMRRTTRGSESGDMFLTAVE